MCFRGTVQANIQGNGSSQMLMSCDCYPATGSTLFKGQEWVCAFLCELACVSQLCDINQRLSHYIHEKHRFLLSNILNNACSHRPVVHWDLKSQLPVSLFQSPWEKKKVAPNYQQWIHHDCRIQLPWPPLSLPIWWPAEDWWAEHPRVREDTSFAPPPWRWKLVYDLQAEIGPLSSPDSSFWMMVWKMENETWYLNINFPGGHASPMGYLSAVLFFRDLLQASTYSIMHVRLTFEFFPLRNLILFY